MMNDEWLKCKCGKKLVKTTKESILIRQEFYCRHCKEITEATVINGIRYKLLPFNN